MPYTAVDFRPNGVITANGPERQTSTSFLNEAQRLALDAALADKQTSTPGLTRSASSRLPRQGSTAAAKEGLTGRSSSDFSQHHERRSRGRGPKAAARVKKGGAGGKYTWGDLLAGAEAPVPPVLDMNDPNYGSSDEESAPVGSLVTGSPGQSQNVVAFKQAAEALIDEYFNSGDMQEASTTLQELDEPALGHMFVKKLVARALDKHNHEREMASILLSALAGEVVSGEQVQKGFRRLVAAAADLKLDVPGAPEQIATFVARAVVDAALPAAFVDDLPAGKDGGDVGAIGERARALLGEARAGDRLAAAWGCGAGLVLDETRAAMGRMLKDYLASEDAAEAEKALRALAVPFFHHEFVRQAVTMALHNPPKQAPLLALLGQLAESGFLSANQITKGFQRVADALARDVPATRQRFEEAAGEAAAAGWLDAAFLDAQCAGGRAPGSANGVPAVPPEVKAYKAACAAAVREYFVSAQASEVAAALQDLGKPDLGHIFVKQAILLALDRGEREREMVSQLLAALCPKPLPQDAVAQGFTDLMLSCEDAALDIPDATHLTALFLGRAIVDEVLPPAFLAAVLRALSDDSLGVHIVQTVRNMLGARHAAERMQRCWAAPAVFSIEHLRASFEALLREFLVSADHDEAACRVRMLDAPHYGHELVKRALLICFEKPDQAPAVLGLLRQLAASGQVSQTQMDTGFARVESDLEDIDLDSPHASSLFQRYKAQALQEGWLAA